MEEDIGLYYSGGSGGFFALWILILGSTYRCEFQENLTLDEIFKQHWNIKDLKTWKSTEILPSNEATLRNTHIQNKIFFYCNIYACENNYQSNFKEGKKLIWPGTGYPIGQKKVLIYTDYETHVALAKAKHANWFNVDPNVDTDVNLSGEEYALESKDYIHIKLQDIIKTQGQILLDVVDSKTNRKVKEFIDFWLNLHPQEIKEKYLWK